MSAITKEFTKEQLIERCEEAIASLKPCRGVSEAKSLACFEIALAVLTAEPAKCGHVNLDCDDGKAVCLSCGKVWEI